MGFIPREVELTGHYSEKLDEIVANFYSLIIQDHVVQPAIGSSPTLDNHLLYHVCGYILQVPIGNGPRFLFYNRQEKFNLHHHDLDEDYVVEA